MGATSPRAALAVVLAALVAAGLSTAPFRPAFTGGPATYPALTVTLLFVADTDTTGVPTDTETGPGVSPAGCTVASTVAPTPGTAVIDCAPVLLV